MYIRPYVPSCSHAPPPCTRPHGRRSSRCRDRIADSISKNRLCETISKTSRPVELDNAPSRRQALPWRAAPHRMGKKGKKSKSGGKKKVAGTCILGSRGAVVVVPAACPLVFHAATRDREGRPRRRETGRHGVCCRTRSAPVSHGVAAASSGRTASTLAHPPVVNACVATRIVPSGARSLATTTWDSPWRFLLTRATRPRMPPNRCDEAGHYIAR